VLPSPDSEKGALAGAPKSLFSATLDNAEDTQGRLDWQALKLRRQFFFPYDTARTVAALAFGGLAR
jgi:hypothetical protein